MRFIRLSLAILSSFPFTSVFAANTSIAVTGTGSYSALPLTSNFSAVIANVTETWQVGGGHSYVLEVHSSNSGLKNGPSLVPYTVFYTCSGAVSSTITINGTDQAIGTRANAAQGSPCNGTVTLAYSGSSAASLYQGTFSDTLTFTYTKDGVSASTQTLVLTSQVVGASVSLTVSGNASATSLPLDSAQSDLVVGNVTEQSNSNTGYKVMVRSANAGKLVNGSHNLAYTLKYGTSGSISPTASDTSINTVPAGLYSGNNSSISVSYSPPGTLAVGTYSDVLTFTIAAQ